MFTSTPYPLDVPDAALLAAVLLILTSIALG